MKEHALGRVLLVRWEGALDGSGPAPSRVAADARHCGARFLLLDTTRASYANSDGLRWLITLRSELEKAGRRLRLAAKPQGKVWRNLTLLQLKLDVYESVGRAWKTPWGKG